LSEEGLVHQLPQHQLLLQVLPADVKSRNDIDTK
jgi:hypothetical protein